MKKAKQNLERKRRMNIMSILSHMHPHTSSPFEPTAAQAQAKASPIANATTSGTNGSSGSSSAASGTSASITANDFLSLLVTEIQNQDPTSQTDPMTYITQLVGVNSLEQLVQINSTLSSGVTTTPATTATGDAGTASSAVVRSAAATAAIQAAQSSSGPAAAANGHVLPAGTIGQVTTASTNAVAQAFTHPAVMPQQVVPPTQIPLNPEVMRALQHSIPGAKLTGPSGAQ
jgi:hypothetical protein